MKKYFFTGLISLLPIALTFLIISWLFDFFTTPFVGVIEKLVVSYETQHGMAVVDHDVLVLFISRVIVLIFLFFLILFLGFCARKFFFNQLLRLTHAIFSRIPVVKSIYNVTRDITRAVFSGDQKTFKQTVLIPFPTPKMHALGLVIGEIPEKLKKVISEDHLSVFVPTAPHPMSGYILMTPKKLTIDVDISTEETFKFLVSCGVYHPGDPASE
jgi:uncharacterized membrane protein